MPSYTDIRKGNVIMYQSNPHLVLQTDHRTPGRRAGFMQVTLRNLKTGSSLVTKFSSTDTVTFCHTETVDVEFSYEDDQGFHFMDPKTYDDIVLPLDILEDRKQYLVPNAKYTLLLVDEKPVELQLPPSMEMKVVESPDAIKGDSVSNMQKTVVMETGLRVQAPLFIKQGEMIKVSTEDGSYMGRA